MSYLTNGDDLHREGVLVGKGVVSDVMGNQLLSTLIPVQSCTEVNFFLSVLGSPNNVGIAISNSIQGKVDFCTSSHVLVLIVI